MHEAFTTLDVVVLVAYILGVTAFGTWLGRRQSGARDYFLAGHGIPWWAICLSVVATETSALTFISAPATSYTSDFWFLQLVFGYLVGRILVATVLLPRYFAGQLDTAYALLGERFGPSTRRFTSIIFMVTRAFADSIRVFAAAIPIQLVTGMSYTQSIVIGTVNEDFAVESLAGDVFQLADALGIGEFTLIGHDWGGAIAWIIAAMGQRTGRVSRLAIANAPHPAIFQHLLWTNEVQRRASQYIRAFRDPANDPFIRDHGLAAFIARTIQWQRPSPFDPIEQARLLSEWQEPGAATGMLNWYRAAAVAVPAPDEPYVLPAGYVPPPIPKIEIPTLVIWALDDEALPPVNLKGLAEHVADLEVVEIADCGHFVQWERPDAVNAALDGFLSRTAD